MNDFDTLWKDITCRKLMSFAVKKFKKKLDYYERKQCKMDGLYYAVNRYNKDKGSSFNTYLVNCVYWYCQKLLSSKIKYHQRFARYGNNDKKYYDPLPLFDEPLILDTFIGRYTLKELAKKYNLSHQTIAKRLNKRLKEWIEK